MIKHQIALSPLNWIPEQSVSPILTGVLRGKKWIIGSSRKACWLGIYERHFQKTLRHWLKTNMVFYDIGANVGFYSLLASEAVQHGKVYSFEPVPRNVAYLRQHLELNHIDNVCIMELAVSDRDGQAAFQESVDNASGHLGPGGLLVNTRSIDSLLRNHEIPPPDCMKIDVEGEEIKVLLGASNCVSTMRPIIFLATHSVDLHEQCRKILADFGYTFASVKTMEGGRADVVATPQTDCTPHTVGLSGQK